MLVKIRHIFLYKTVYHKTWVWFIMGMPLNTKGEISLTASD